MGATSRQQVVDMAPELATLPDPAPPASSEWRAALADAALLYGLEVYGDRQELAQRLYVAHVLTLAHPALAQRALASVSMGGMTKSFVSTGAAGAGEARDAWLMSTRYGQQLLQVQYSLLSAAGPVLL